MIITNKLNVKTMSKKINWSAGGSIQNRLAEAQVNTPVVGEGATEIMYSDRHAYFVTYVSKDGKECTIQRAKYKCLDYYAGRYEVEPDPEGSEISLRFRYGKWRIRHQDEWTGKTEWYPFNVAFGYAREYEDPSF